MQINDANQFIVTPYGAVAMLRNGVLMTEIPASRVSACGCLPDLGSTHFTRECDACGIVYLSASCRHGSPRCPRCGDVTE